MAAKTPPFAAKIKYEMSIQGKDFVYVAAKCMMCRSSLYSRIKNPDTLTLGEYQALCKTLGIDPVETLSEYVCGRKS